MLRRLVEHTILRSKTWPNDIVRGACLAAASVAVVALVAATLGPSRMVWAVLSPFRMVWA